MRSDGIGTFLAIARRSAWVVALLVVLGVAQMNVIRQTEGPLYVASARVILSPTDLGAALAGVNSYVDPNLIDQTEQALANSPQLYSFAAARNGSLGNSGQLESASSATKNGSTITFTATSPRSSRATAIVNAVANAYPAWRAAVSSRAIDQGISQIRAQLKGPTKGNADLVAQLERLRVLKTLTSGNVLLVEPAGSAAKVRPRLLKDSLLGGLIGLFIALLVVGAREALDSKVRSEGEVEEMLDAPVIGRIETLPRSASTISFGRGGERFADMYSLLAASIVQQRPGTRTEPTVIAVTSATAQEGKTTTAVNLAAAFARRDVSVRLVDLDTRRPSIGRVLRIPAEAPGGERALQNGSKIGQLLWDVTLNGSGPRVRRSSGRRPATNGNRFQVLPLRASPIKSLVAHEKQVEALIKEAATDAEYVVIDTPPALSTPDVTELVKLVDLVLVVVRHGRVSRRNLEALHRLHETWPEVEVRAVMVGSPVDGNTYDYYPSN